MFHNLAALAFQLWPHIQHLSREVEARVGDGAGLSARESEELAIELSRSLGDLQIKIRGKDVLHTPAQEHLFAALGRVCRQIALTMPRGG